MEMPATFVQITVYDPTSASTKTLQYTNRDDPRVTTYGGNQWLPLMTKSPTMTMSVFNGDFTGSGDISYTAMELNLNGGELDELVRYAWHGATITCWVYYPETTVLTKLFTARGNGVNRQGRNLLQVELIAQSDVLDRNLLYLSYAGTGDIEGNTDLAGVPKPMIFGDAKFVDPVLIDPVRQIYQVHGYGPVKAIYNVFEGGQLIGTGGVDAGTLSGTYSAFRDTAVAQGQWIRHNNLGLIKLGSQPTFPITAHVQGDTNNINGGAFLYRPGEIVKRMVQMATSASIKSTSMSNLDTAEPAAHDLYFTSQVTVKEAVERILTSIGGYWTWDEHGQLILGRVRFGSSTINLNANNSMLPDVVSTDQMATSSPIWSFRLGAEQCHFVHDAASIAGVIGQLQTDVAAVQVSVAGKNKVFPASASPPAGAIDGDIWPDTSQPQIVLRRYSGGTWQKISTAGATVGSDLITVGGVTLIEADIRNNQISIGSNGALVGGAGGQVTLPGLGYEGSLQATQGGVPSILTNPQFQLYTTTPGVPNYWQNNGTPVLGSMQRTVGETGQNAFTLAGTAGNFGSVVAQMGSTTRRVFIPNQWIVLEADVRLESGSLVGAGLFFQGLASGGGGVHNIIFDFATQPDITGVAPGNGVVGNTYRFRKTFQLPNDAAIYWGYFYINSHSTLHGSIAASNSLQWMLANVRPATDTEIKTAGQETEADVTKVATGPNAAELNYSSTGVLTSTIPKAITGYKITPAGSTSPYTSGVTAAVAVTAGSFVGAAPSISVTGGIATVSLNSGLTGADATIEVTLSYNGKPYPPVPTKITRNTAAPDVSGGSSSGGTTGNKTVYATLVGTTYVVLHTGNLSVTAGSGGAVDLSAQLSLINYHNLGRTVTVQAQRQTSPGVWADVGSAASGVAPGVSAGDSGYVSLTVPLTGLTGAQDFRLLGKLNGSASAGVDVSGDFTGTGS